VASNSGLMPADVESVVMGILPGTQAPNGIATERRGAPYGRIADLGARREDGNARHRVRCSGKLGGWFHHLYLLAEVLHLREKGC
jgi:hypothetical protein